MTMRNKFGERQRRRLAGAADALLEVLLVPPRGEGEAARGTAHPDAERLAAWAEGRLEGAAAETVAVHVRGCGACREAVLDLQAVLFGLPAPDVALRGWCGRLAVAIGGGPEVGRVRLRWDPLPAQTSRGWTLPLEPRLLRDPKRAHRHRSRLRAMQAAKKGLFAARGALWEPPAAEPASVSAEGGAEGASLSFEACGHRVTVGLAGAGGRAGTGEEPALRLTVERDGAPAAGLVVRIAGPVGRQAVTATDARGRVTLPLPWGEAVLTLGEGEEEARVLVRRTELP